MKLNNFTQLGFLSLATLALVDTLIPLTIKAATITIQPLNSIEPRFIIPFQLPPEQPITSTEPFDLIPNTPTILKKQEKKFNWTDLIISDITEPFTVLWNLPGFNGEVTVNGSSSNLDSGTLTGNAGQTVIFEGTFPNEVTATNFLSDKVTVTPSGEPIPEPTSVLSLLALGILGAGATLKNKLKPTHSTEKEPANIG